MFLTQEYFSSLGISLDEGLSDVEVIEVEARYGFRFPPDLKELLQFGLPTGRGFVDWRNGSVEDIQYILDGPFDGICFDIEHNNFWLAGWGTKPESLTGAFGVAKKYVDTAPKLIPVFGHRYIPETPHEIGNPIFSVVQTDIIVYGINLEIYLKSEFAKSSDNISVNSHVQEKFIEFWTPLVELNDERLH